MADIDGRPGGTARKQDGYQCDNEKPCNFHNILAASSWWLVAKQGTDHGIFLPGYSV